MTYPSSTDVSDGQPTAYQHYNTLRADALTLGQPTADVQTLGAFLQGYIRGVRLEYLATNRLRIAYDSKNPPTLMLAGSMLQANANVDLPASSFSGGAAIWYVFANFTAGTKTFSLTVNTSPTPTAAQRLIGEVYWDGSNLTVSRIKTYSAARHGPFCHVNRSALNINTAAWTSITWNTLVHDTSNFWSAGAPTLLTVPETGLYMMMAAGQFTANSTGIRGMQFLLDGTTVVSKTLIASIGGTLAMPFFSSALAFLNAGQTLEMQVYQTSGGVLELNFVSTYSPYLILAMLRPEALI